MTKSYATERKLRIIREKYGTEMNVLLENKSVDALYSEVIGDKRKNLFCKISPETKSMVDEMIEQHDITMAIFIEAIIRMEYDRFLNSETERVQYLAQQFTV